MRTHIGQSSLAKHIELALQAIGLRAIDPVGQHRIGIFLENPSDKPSRGTSHGIGSPHNKIERSHEWLEIT
jgi:hypothetical protein